MFVGPDNGVLSWALAKEKITAIHALENEAYFLQPVSRTFHGRDVFAPVAAHLSLGVPIKKFGPALRNFVRLDWPEPRRQRGGIEGEVVYIDRFGNAITNLQSSLLTGFRDGLMRGPCKGPQSLPAEAYYQAGRTKHPGRTGGFKRLPGDSGKWRLGGKGLGDENPHPCGDPHVRSLERITEPSPPLNPKAEIRYPKEIRSPKSEKKAGPARCSGLGFRASFGFRIRISDLGLSGRRFSQGLTPSD